MKNSEIDLLIHNESLFEKLAEPKHFHPSENILATSCCMDKCNLFISRVTILKARFDYVQFAKKMPSSPKRTIRHLFLETIIKHHPNESIEVVYSIPACLLFYSRIFAVSYDQIISSSDGNQGTLREGVLYRTTIDKLGKVIKTISSFAQFNPVGGIMIPPDLNERSFCRPRGAYLPRRLVRKYVKAKIKRKKADLLMRCTVCCALKHTIRNSFGRTMIIASKKLRRHYDFINHERSTIATLAELSRDPDSDLTLFKLDGMSNRFTKIPQLVCRPKSITDADRLALKVDTSQLAESNENHDFTNFDYFALNGKYAIDSSYILSLFIDSLTRLKVIGSHVVVVFDGCATNRSDIMFAGMCMLISKIKSINKITLLYQSTGHSHNSVDAHFGTLSKKLKISNIKDPNEFREKLLEIASVHQVIEDATIYDFTPMSQFTKKYKYRTTNHQFIFRRKNNRIVWSTAKFINSKMIFESESYNDSFEMFQDNFDPSTFSPNIRKSNIMSTKPTAETLIKTCGAFMSSQNGEELIKHLEIYGKQSFRRTISIINSIKKKKMICDDDEEETAVSIINFLKELEFKTIRLPQDPLIPN